MKNSKIVLIPLDDRPCNFRFPVQLGVIGGCEVMTPPQNLMGGLHNPGDCEAIMEWLTDVSEPFDVAILSFDMICYGGLVASRTADVGLPAAIARMEKIERWKESHPQVSVFAFNVITRLSITVRSDAAARLYELLNRYAQVLDQAECERNEDMLAEADKLRRQIPEDLLEDYLTARQRNHQVNLHSVRCVRNQVIDHLVLCQEDCAPFGFHRKEQAALRKAIEEQGVTDRVNIYPGTDEVACTLLARHILATNETRPTVRVVYSDLEGAGRIPPFEDQTLDESVRLHIASSGATVASPQEREDLLLFINVSETMTREEAAIESIRARRTEQRAPFVEEIANSLEADQAVALADVAFPNGGDPVLLDLLFKRAPIARLLSYGGWNTAGNTLGTVLAHSLIRRVSLRENGSESDTTHYEFLFERFIDDWAYQAVVRRELQDRRATFRGASIFDLGDSAHDAEQFVRERLTSFVEDLFTKHFQPILQSPTPRWSLALPWKRSFECDFRVFFQHDECMSTLTHPVTTSTPRLP